MRFILLFVSVLVAYFLFVSVPHGMITPGDYACNDCNVVIFTIDTLRADHLSSYNYYQKTTPAADSLANEGITFTNAFAQIPHTPPSHWSMFTGLYPYKHDKFIPTDNGSGFVTLPDVLKNDGYTTSGFISSKMLIGFNEEFDYFNGYADNRRKKTFISRDAEETTGVVLSWLGNHSSEKFFMWVHYFDPHSPYEPPEEHDVYDHTGSGYYSNTKYDERGLSGNKIRDDISKYDGEIRHSDYWMGKVLDKIEEFGLDGKTLVILLSDHGECFGEHRFSDFGYDKYTPCLFHGKTLYDQEIHVPMIIKNPGYIANGIRIDNIVETVDLFPTITEILGISEDRKTDGESLIALIERSEREKDYAISQTRPRKNGSFTISIRDDEWKFVIVRPSDFDIKKDVAEQEGMELNFMEDDDNKDFSKKLLLNVKDGENYNFHETEPKTAEEMENKLGEIIAGDGLKTIELDEEAEEILKSLGYMV